MGRRRYIPEIQSTLPMEIAQGERQAVNTIIQGTASDLLKKAMLAVEERLVCWPNPETKPSIILQIHDELIYEMKLSNNNFDIASKDTDSEAAMFIQLLSDCMENISGSSVPTPTNIQIGYSWGNMVKYTPIINDLAVEAQSSRSDSSTIIQSNSADFDGSDSQPVKKIRRSVD